MKIKAKYCVIGKSVNGQYGVPRNWAETKDDAVDHAKELVGSASANLELYVVEIVAVVRKSHPPIEVVEVE